MSEPEAAEPTSNESSDEATTAFNRLASEIFEANATLRIMRKEFDRGVEHIEKLRSAPDYGADLGRLEQTQAAIEQRLSKIEQSPLLKNSAENYARRLQDAENQIVRNVSNEVRERVDRIDAISQKLSDFMALARDSALQKRMIRRWSLIALGVGCVLGCVLILFTPRFLPGSPQYFLAKIVLGEDGWNGGFDLARSENPQNYDVLSARMKLLTYNKDVIEQCRATAEKTKTEQKCAISIPFEK